MATPQTRRPKPGTTPLSEAARHVILPAGIVDTAWPAVRDTCAKLGITFDRWQDGAGRAILARGSDGKYAADTTVLSIPRQVGKTFLLGSIVFALCQIHPGMTVIWTAHHGRTTDEAFGSMQALANMPKIAAKVRAIRRAAGEQGIHFINGSRILFGAREQGFGRGFSAVDVIVFDEAQRLSESAIDDMLPATNQAATGNPLILMAGTPPIPNKDNGEVFTNRRREALEAGSGVGDTLYIEFSADPTAEADDRAQWAKANPSYPHRTPAKAILRLLKHLGPASFRREALGIWDASSRLAPVISPDAWAALTRPAPDGEISCIAVKFAPDGSRQAVVVSTPTDDAAFVEAIPILTGSSSVGINRIAEWIAERAETVDAVVIDGKSGAGSLVDALLDLGVRNRKIIRPTVDQVIAANTGLLESVRDAVVSHAAQPGVVASVAGSTRRTIGNLGGWGFKPIATDDDETPIEAIALAVHWTGGPRTKNGTRRTGRAVSG